MDIQTDLNQRERTRFAQLTEVLTDFLATFRSALVNEQDQMAMQAFTMAMLTIHSLVNDIGPVFLKAQDIAHAAEHEISTTDMEANLRAILDWGKDGNGETD